MGEPARGEALIARMDRTLAELARDPAPPLRVAAWDGSGFAAGTGTLYDAVLQAAGARNVGREAASAGGGRPDVERLLQTAPALLVRGARDRSDRGLRDDVARHRLVRRWWGAARTVTIRQAAYACGTPMVADAAVSLRTQLRAAAAAARPLPFAPATMR